MRPIAEMATVQIEWTSACVLKCSNCTRFCGTHQTPFFLEWEEFTRAVDSLVGFVEGTANGIVGAMGGEPLLHPDFEKMCEYMRSRIPRDRAGLWSTFPPGKKFIAYRETISKTFGNILLNDHSRDDILHAPVLMGSEEYFDNDEDLFLATERCWIQESWSAAINPKGAWFCEVAAALSDLFDGPKGWDVVPGWWKKTPKDFAAQREWACRMCGAALPIARVRNSQDVRDDVSPKNLERLRAIKSKKIARGEFVVHEKFEFDPKLQEQGTYPRQTYKDHEYRQGIARRYGIYLVLNERGYWDPRLMDKPPEKRESLFKIFQEEYNASEPSPVGADRGD